MPYDVSFPDLKEVPIERVFPLLDTPVRKENAEWRASCPACKRGGNRALSINPAKNSYYCQVEGRGGDLIALVAHARGLTGKGAQYAAAKLIAEHLGRSGAPNTTPTTPPSPEAARARSSRPAFDAEKYLADLDQEHPSLDELRLTKEMCQEFGVGYVTRGSLRERVAFRVDDPRGQCLGFVGRTLSDESPFLKWPKGSEVDSRSVIYNAHRIGEGELLWRAEPLDVIHAVANGKQAVCFLTETVTSEQLEMLVALLDERKAVIVP